jgi:hypothetical protein
MGRPARKTGKIRRVNENACNEVLSLFSDGGLTLHAMMNTGLGRAGEDLDVEHLSLEDAAEYFMAQFT